MDFEDCINGLIKSLENIDEIILEITEEPETQKFLIDVIQDQLYNTGEDGNGLSLGEYSPVTVQIKRRKGDPTDRITLVDTGEFYDSWTIDPFLGGFIIDGDGQKGASDNLFVTYGDDIQKPNDETLTLIAEYYETKLFEYFSNLF
jgi:hypothetical protein